MGRCCGWGGEGCGWVGMVVGRGGLVLMMGVVVSAGDAPGNLFMGATWKT